MKEIYIPTLHSFVMNNIFTGSCGEFRFRAAPQIVMQTAKEVDVSASTILAEFWHGKFCYEKSTMEGSCIFPMSEAGRMEMKVWLEENI